MEAENSGKTLHEENALPLLPGAYYFNNLFSQSQCDHVFKSVSENLRGTFRGITGMKGPRVTPFGRFGTNVANYPEFLEVLISVLLQHKIIDRKPNQVSVNQYENPAKGMVPHKDGPGKLGVIMTFGAPAALEFYKTKPEPLLFTRVYEEKELDGKKMDTYVMMMPGSALLLTGESYVDWAHGIQAREEDEVTEQMANLKQTGLKVGEKLKRGNRISIVAWVPEDKK